MADQEQIKKLIATFEGRVITATLALKTGEGIEGFLKDVDKAREALLEAYKRKC